MGETILETDSGVVARIGCFGSAHGFPVLTPGISISTPRRGKIGDYVVLTKDEAIRLAREIMVAFAPTESRP